jgi:formylglycine-generating enzyme required for sulfatase activity
MTSMNASRIALLVAPMLVAALVHPAASDDCREEDLDAQGKCPKPPPAKPPRPRPAPGVPPPPPRPTVKPGSCPDEMVHVPAATLVMRGAIGTKDLQHTVTLSGYCIDRTEVTVKAYQACVAVKGCVATKPRDASPVRYCNGPDRPDHPINCVDWNQAAAYCTWADKRLPTEAEWEYATRGVEIRTYPWGNEAPGAKLLNKCGSECVAMAKRDQNADWPATYEASDSWGATAPVGSFPDGKSPFGVLDMAGNVMEWTADWYGAYAAAATTNPHGAKAGTLRVVRGGSWHPSGSVRVEARDHRGPTVRADDLGFRCARGD